MIQVAYSVVDEKAYNREFGAFADLDNSNQKIIITNDVVDYSSSTVRHIKLEDFLMMEELYMDWLCFVLYKSMSV